MSSCYPTILLPLSKVFRRPYCKVAMDYIHQTRWIEIIKERGFVAYPEGTPPLSINMKGYKAFHIYKYTIGESGVEYPPVEITRWISVFQQEWRRRAWARRRGLQWIRRRELGGSYQNPPQSYKLERRPSRSASSASVAQ
jgi:hypothetical protein